MKARPLERRAFVDESTRRGDLLALDPRAFGFVFDVVETRPMRTEDGIAFVAICGPLEHHDSWWFDNYTSIIARTREAFACEEAKAVVLCIDSPGGAASGMIEAHKSIRALREEFDKPLFAYVDEQAASAGYGLASAADEIWIPETGEVGSVGVFAAVYEVTEHNKREGINARLFTSGARKGDGHPWKPITDDVANALQAKVDQLAESFWAIVAKSRGLSIKQVAKLEAESLIGKKAVAAKLADGIASFETFLSIKRASLGLAQPGISESSSRQQIGGSANPSTEVAMDKFATLTKKVEEAKAALLAAKTETERQAALVAYDAAVDAATTYKRTKETEEETSDDEKKDAEDEDLDESSEEKCDDEDDDDKSSTEDGDDDAEGKKALESKTGLYTFDRLFRLCRQVTGKSKVREVFGALDALGQVNKRNAELEDRVKRLERNERNAEKTVLLKAAVTEGKITPANAKALESKSLGFIRGHLALLPKKAVRTLEDGPLKAPEFNVGDPLAGLTDDMKKIIEQKATLEGRPVADVARELVNAHNETNGTARY